MLTVQTKTEKITKVFEGKLKDKDAFFFFLFLVISRPEPVFDTETSHSL